MEWKRWPGMTDERIGGWTEYPNNYWWRNRCDRCGERHRKLYDVYPKKVLAYDGFGWVDAECLIEILAVMYE